MTPDTPISGAAAAAQARARRSGGDASAAGAIAPADAAAFAEVWPRSFALADLRDWLGDEADGLLRDVIAGQVNGPLWELVERGGKRWRAIVLRLAYRAAGGEGAPPAVLGEVVELLHNASLVVDDIEDGAAERRGGPSVHAAHGVPVALNAANAAYFRALAALRPALAAGARLRALDMLAEELFAAHLGQALDLALGAVARLGVAVEERHYRALVRAKTGALVRIAARLAAIAAGAPAEVESALARWAGDLGVAYQIQDDCDDALDGPDLEDGRLSLPLLRAIADAAPADAAALLGALGDPEIDPGARAEAARIVLRAGAVEHSRRAAGEAAARAVAALSALPEGDARAALIALTRRLVGGKERHDA